MVKGGSKNEYNRIANSQRPKMLFPLSAWTLIEQNGLVVRYSINLDATYLIETRERIGNEHFLKQFAVCLSTLNQFVLVIK